MKRTNITTALISLLVVGLLASDAAAQGSINPTNGPAPTMHTLEEIYQNQMAIMTNQTALEARLATIEARMASMGMQTTSGDMVLIPTGDFVMGDTFGDGSGDELPLHTNSISAFYMDATEVTKTNWAGVYTWATNNGYAFDNVGSGKAADHPVHTVNWYDCVKWANARSEMDGFTPCYTTNGAVYRTGASDDVDCNWSASGYRLPTEAEWEKAARGGTANRRFPWDDVNTIQHGRANYSSRADLYTYDTNPTSGYHPDYDSGGEPYTSPVGSFAANGFGLYDMAGNLYEWCWDWHSSGYYANSPSVDPRGPASGVYRVMRGGRCNEYAYHCRVADRNNNCMPRYGFDSWGFRLVRAAP